MKSHTQFIERPAAAGAAARPSDAPASAQYRDRLGEIAARLDRLARRAQGPAIDDGARGAMPGDPPQRLTDAIDRLDQRIDQMIADNRALDARPRAPGRTTSAAPSFSLDDAVAEIAARQHALETEADGLAAQPPAPAVDLSGVEHLLHNITDQIETLRRPCRLEDSLADLRSELAEIGRVVTEATPQPSLDAMQSELRSLSERIDRGATRGADDRTLTAIERGLNEVRDALNARPTAPTSAGFDQFAATGPDGETLGHLETAIAELRNVSARVASGDALAAVATDVRTIGAKLDRVAAPASDPDGMDHLLRRIDALAVALEARPAANEIEGADIEAQLKRLTDKLEMVETAAERRGFDQLEGQIAQLTRKLDTTDARLGNLGTIEHAIADLMERLHDTRIGALDAAEQAARTAVREMMVAPGAPRTDVDPLKHELAEFRAAQADIDRRTQDLLETLQGTLERLVDRIGAIETDVHARTMVAGESAPDAASAPPAAAPPSRPMPPAVRPERRPINTGLPADLPLEPGTGAPRGRPATPAERIAASEALRPAAKPAAEPAGKANFIAAARRAAQAAAADASAEGTRSPETRTRGAGLGSIGGAISKRRRPLMIGLGILLLVLGTLQLVSSMLGSGEPRSAPSQATTPRGSTPPVPSPQSTAPAAPTDLAPASPPAAEPKPDGETKVDPTGGTVSAPLDGMVPVIPPFPTVPGSADATGSTGRAPATVAIASPAAVEPALAVDKEPPATPGPGLRTAALAGNPAAEYELAVRYAEGRGLPANVQEAVHWFELAANHGIAPAQYRLGSLYEKGQGVKKDLDAARRLYTAAANKGNGKAMHNLAVLYAEGLNGEPDYRSASQWFRKAAEHGIADSQYNLGILYARGIGVEQNLAESYKWFALAAQQGDKDAVKKRDDVAGRLDQQSLIAARLAVQTWSADPQPEEAVDVKVPPGGWDKPAAAPRPAKVKPAVGAPRKLTPT